MRIKTQIGTQGEIQNPNRWKAEIQNPNRRKADIQNPNRRKAEIQNPNRKFESLTLFWDLYFFSVRRFKTQIGKKVRIKTQIGLMMIGTILRALYIYSPFGVSKVKSVMEWDSKPKWVKSRCSKSKSGESWDSSR